MKAHDTVMLFMRIEEIDAKNATSNFTDALMDVAREQAEISFKAGIKEVVEWVEQRRYTHLFDLPGWQAKLKEWGC